MSVYNGEEFLAEAIESIIQQSFTDFEFIIVNDGSKDGTEKIIESFKDPRIVNIDLPTNVGLIASLNRGLQYAHGKYIARMDADDVAVMDRLKLQVEAFDKNANAIIVGTDYYSFTKRNKTLVSNINDSEYLKALLLFGPSYCHPTVMIKNIFKAKGINYNRDYLHVEDYRLWTELAQLGDFVNINKPLLFYRSHSNQISNIKRMEQLRKCASIRSEYLHTLKINFTEKQFVTHNFLSDNYFIRNKVELNDIEEWLCYLVEKNNENKSIATVSFNRCIQKMWKDSCGNTKFGLFAFRSYYKSSLSKIYPTNLSDQFILLGKCIIRSFKK